MNDAKTSPGPVNCSIRKRFQNEASPRTCERCGLGPCPFFNNDGTTKLHMPPIPRRGAMPEDWLDVATHIADMPMQDRDYAIAIISRQLALAFACGELNGVLEIAGWKSRDDHDHT